MAVSEVLAAELCKECLLCFQTKLLSKFTSHCFQPFSNDREYARYLIIYLSPTIQMLENDFDLTKKNYGYKRFLNILGEDYIHHPIVRAYSIPEIKSTASQERLCKTFLLEYMFNTSFKYIIVLGKHAAKIMSLEMEKFTKMKLNKKIVTAIALESPTSKYFTSSSLMGDNSVGDEYYRTYLTMLEEL